MSVATKFTLGVIAAFAALAGWINYQTPFSIKHNLDMISVVDCIVMGITAIGFIISGISQSSKQ